MTIDAFAFPKTDKPDQIEAQHKLADLMMDPAVQTEFTRYKGSVPSMLQRQHRVAGSLRASRASM